MRLHKIIRAAAGGKLPDWAVVGPTRKRHIERVAALMDEWAQAQGLKKKKRARWVAAGLLHDALRDEDPDVLRKTLPRRFRDLPGPVLHGPAAAERLRREGVEDEALLLAVAFHTLGHPDLGSMGRALCCADYLEPGRTGNRAFRDRLLARMPSETDEVLREILEGRLDNLRRRGGRPTEWTRALLKTLGGNRK